MQTLRGRALRRDPDGKVYADVLAHPEDANTFETVAERTHLEQKFVFKLLDEYANREKMDSRLLKIRGELRMAYSVAALSVMRAIKGCGLDFHHSVLVSEGTIRARDLDNLDESLAQYGGTQTGIYLGRYGASKGVKPGIYVGRQANEVLEKLGREDLVIGVDSIIR